MSPQVSLSAFHHWLLEVRAPKASEPHVLVIGDADAYPTLAQDIAHHLNQYHDHGGGKWLSFSAPTLDAILADPCQLALLNVQPPCEKCGIASACGKKKLLIGIARHGYAVLDSIHAFAATKDLENVFRVSLGNPKGEWHVRLSPTLFPASCLAPIIGDIYLEWLECHCEE